MSKEKTPVETKAKEEAERLVIMFRNTISNCNPLDDFTNTIIKCALIHVEGIIDEMNEFENSFSGYGGLKMKTRISQLKEVKQELNKML